MDLFNQFSILFDPSQALGAFLISFFAGIVSSFFIGIFTGKKLIKRKESMKKNMQNIKSNQGIIIQDSTIKNSTNKVKR